MKVKYEGGQVLTDVMPDLKKTKFSLLGVVFFIYCAVSGGAFGIESIIPSSGPGVTLLLLVVIPLMWALPMGLYGSGLISNWSLMITVATWVGAIMLVLCVICFLVGKKIDPIPDDDE